MKSLAVAALLGCSLFACKKSAPEDKAHTKPDTTPQCTKLVERLKACPDAATSKMSDPDRAAFFEHQHEGCVLAFAAGDAPPTATGRDSQDAAEVTAYAQAITRRSAACAATEDCAKFIACIVAPVQ